MILPLGKIKVRTTRRAYHNYNQDTVPHLPPKISLRKRNEWISIRVLCNPRPVSQPSSLPCHDPMSQDPPVSICSDEPVSSSPFSPNNISPSHKISLLLHLTDSSRRDCRSNSAIHQRVDRESSKRRYTGFSARAESL